MELKLELEQPFAWPWVGVLANIPIQWKDDRFVGPSGFILKQQLSQTGFNPFKVEILWTQRGHSGFALVEFQKDYNGLLQATLFDKSFQESGCGNKDWNNAMVSPAILKLYGWIAREDDYRFEGIVGHHLRKFRDLSNSDIVYHRMRTSQVHGFSSCVDGLIKEKDEMVQRYHEDMSRTHHGAQKHLEKIISQREKVTVLLEARRQEIETRSKELVEGVPQNETELREIQNEKYEIEEATLAQRKGDHNFVLLVEKHKKVKEELHKKIIDFEKDVDDKYMLQLEIERMRGALRVMRYLGDVGDEEMIEKMHIIQGRLKQKEEEYRGIEAMNQTLIVKRRSNNNKLQGDGKELTEYLKGGSRNMSTGVIKGQHLDSKPFLAGSKGKYSEEKAMNLYPRWQQFVTVEGSSKEEIGINDERLKCIRNEHGDEVDNAGWKLGLP